MLNPTPQTTYLKDYRPPAYLISNVTLDIDIEAAATVVRAALTITRNAGTQESTALVLHGDGLELLSVALDGRELVASEYSLDTQYLTITHVPAQFTLATVVRIHPEQNTQLMGLYASQDGYFTQCEAEGFRRITFFVDRPDVMARYVTVIHAERKRFPLLLSNGNLDASGDEADGRHWARWVDPFPKPSYLFALVAARLDERESEFVTCSGRTVKLKLFVEPGKLDQCAFAMEALQAAMRWDEEVFGLELDLDTYMIVAVGDFNMGAMENKGLNVFNTKYVLARADTATDMDFMMLDRVVAHEYFHNWTGNRVTCRDWFQLSLKEGLTVFRDQQYGGDRYSHAVQRIQEVRVLRAAQFPEDASPMAHPVRPESFIEISNFYTATVYNKGAEVVRMIHTLLGPAGFRAGMDLYFKRHDGQAVRTEDFVAAMQDASSVDLTLFKHWYGQAGTPVVTARGSYDAEKRRYTLHLAQACPPTPGQDSKLPFQIPIALALLDSAGREMPLRLSGEAQASGCNRVLSLCDAQADWVFEDIDSLPVPSLLRGFSAPVVLRCDYSAADLAHLMAHDSDSFNRWEAGQRLALDVLLAAIVDIRAGREPSWPEDFVAACGRLIADAPADPGFAAEALSLPAAGYIAEQLHEVDADAILAARVALRRHLATRFEHEWRRLYMSSGIAGPYTPDPVSAGRRSLRNLALGFLLELETTEVHTLALQQLQGADNMTDAMAALSALANSDCAERVEALRWFYDKWQDEPLVVDKWLAVQASSRLPNTLAEVQRLLTHAAFDMRNPNKVRAVIGAFCQGNHVRFNAADGSGYAFAAEQVIALDPHNAQVAARMARSFDRWRKFDAEHQAHARTALLRIRDTEGLSKDTFEVVSRALA